LALIGTGRKGKLFEGQKIVWIFVWTNFGFYEEKVKHQGEVVFKWQE
jgi:hypothetical protein